VLFLRNQALILFVQPLYKPQKQGKFQQKLIKFVQPKIFLGALPRTPPFHNHVQKKEKQHQKIESTNWKQ
jgi:hypothetical protein